MSSDGCASCKSSTANGSTPCIVRIALRVKLLDSEICADYSTHLQRLASRKYCTRISRRHYHPRPSRSESSGIRSKALARHTHHLGSADFLSDHQLVLRQNTPDAGNCRPCPSHLRLLCSPCDFMDSRRSTKTRLRDLLHIHKWRPVEQHGSLLFGRDAVSSL